MQCMLLLYVIKEHVNFADVLLHEVIHVHSAEPHKPIASSSKHKQHRSRHGPRSLGHIAAEIACRARLRRRRGRLWTRRGGGARSRRRRSPRRRRSARLRGSVRRGRRRATQIRRLRSVGGRVGAGEGIAFTAGLIVVSTCPHPLATVFSHPCVPVGG